LSPSAILCQGVAVDAAYLRCLLGKIDGPVIQVFRELNSDRRSQPAPNK
jgi:hypothetical protein